MSSIGKTPFFIVGCPRSGTTLLQLLLDAHPNIAIPQRVISLSDFQGFGRVMGI